MSQSRHRTISVTRNGAAHALLRALDSLGEGRHFLTDDLYPVYRKIAPPTRSGHTDFHEFAIQLDTSGLVSIHIGSNYSTIQMTREGSDELFLLDNPPSAPVRTEPVAATKAKLISWITPPPRPHPGLQR